MSAAGTTDGTKAEPYPFSVATSEKFEKFARPYIFPAGEWIAAPGRVVVGWHRIVSGIVATSDENMADLARRGIVLEPGDMFGEYALVPNGRPFPSGLRALTEVTTRCLPAEVYPGLAAEIKGLDLLVRRREKLNRFLPAFMAALKRHRSLENVPPYQLMKLAQLGEVIELSDGAALGLQVDTFDLVFVASGELEIANLARLPAGSLFRYVQDPSGQWPTVAREKETVLLRVDRRRVAQVAPRYIHLSSALRHESERTTRRPDAHGAVESSTANLARPGNGRTRASKRAARAQVVEPASVAKPVGATTLRVNTALVWSDRELPPLAALTALLAHALQLEQPRDGDFKVGLLILQPSGTGSPKAKRGAKNNGFELPAQVSANDDGVRVLRWSVREGCEGQDLSTGLAELKVDTDLILIDPSHCRTDQMAAALGTVVSKMLYFVGDSFAPVPSAFRHREISITRCVLLREATWGTFTAYYPGTVRLHFDNFAGLGDRKLSRLSDRDRNSVSRCGRALMERRVGIALGGGAAWGYAHVALLEELARVKMPIDVISGVSFGSLAGAFYAAGGLDLLYELVPRGVKLQLALLASSMLPPLVQQYLTSILEDRRLEFLEIPFFPVGLNLETGEEWTPATGPVAQGVRASSMLPGMFSPFITDGVRSVDGVFINNVPEGILTRERADFIIASDVMQSPGNPFGPAPRRRLDFVAKAWRTFKSISPIERMKDNMQATAYLTQIADERDTGIAHVRFEPQRSGVAMWNFGKGQEIIESARASAVTFAQDARAKWNELGKERAS